MKEIIENHTGEKDEEPKKKKKTNVIKAHDNLPNVDTTMDYSFDEEAKEEDRLKDIEKKMKELDQQSKQIETQTKKDTFDSPEHAAKVKVILPKKSKKVEKEALNLAENLFNEKTISLGDLKKDEALAQDDKASAVVLQKAIEDAFEVKP